MNARHYTVEACGHGSPYVRNDPPEELTLEEAKEEARRWALYSDTIGGDARVVDLRTNEVVWAP